MPTVVMMVINIAMPGLMASIQPIISDLDELEEHVLPTSNTS
ncbi:MAG: hypothetical protein ACI9JL_003882 [Paracoccaceae bacterium]